MALEIIYFDIRGKAEPLRLICAQGGLEFKDTRLTKDQFVEMKSNGELPYKQLPALKVGSETMLVQSAAIARYLGKKAGLYPTDDDILAAKIDAIVDQENDLFCGYVCMNYPERYGFGGLLKDTENSKMAWSEYNTAVIPKHMKYFEDLMETSSTGFIAGTPGPTIADFILAVRIKDLFSGKNPNIDAGIFANYPKMQGLVEKIENLENVKKYYNK
eukprot:m.83568 g.83568  ORF g.83568 m.83568 type:complete len:216 (+) comp12927_c0_seq5:167-814(+)